MTDERDRTDGTEPDPDADRWSAWLPPFDPTSDHTGAAGPGQSDASSQGGGSGGSRAAGGPVLPQSPGPAVPPATRPQLPPPGSPPLPPPVPPPTVNQRAWFSYRSVPSAPPTPPTPPTPWARPPKRHLALSIFSAFFGVTVLGIIAIVFSLSVGGHVRSGRLADAERASRRARSCALVALALQLLYRLLQAFVLNN